MIRGVWKLRDGLTLGAEVTGVMLTKMLQEGAIARQKDRNGENMLSQ